MHRSAHRKWRLFSILHAEAMLLRVRRGKGRVDRTVPLPEHILTLLRRYWRTHRNQRLIFPALGRGQTGGHTATEPMNRASVQGAFRRALKAALIAGIPVRPPSTHRYAFSPSS